MIEYELNERQREILRYVICNFIVSASPIASQYLAKHHDLGLSPATIRAVLADLEDMGYLMHPHTSAGKIPTDKGYRFFVDSLMELEPLSENEKGNIRREFDAVSEPDGLFHSAAKLLGSISRQLSVVSPPHLRESILDHIELISLSSSKIVVVLSVNSGIVKTITMEVVSEISPEQLISVAQLLNERLGGLTLEIIRDTFSERVKDFKDEKTGLINLFVRSADKIFDDSKEREKLHIGGTQSLIEQPEYGDPRNIKNIIELINNEGVLVNVLERKEEQAKQDGISIWIGEEHGEENLKNYSLIVATYNAGDVVGSIGIIGPKRMNYAKVVPLVNHIAQEVSSSLR